MLSELTYRTDYEPVQSTSDGPIVEPLFPCASLFCPANCLIGRVLDEPHQTECTVAEEYLGSVRLNDAAPFNKLDLWFLRREYPFLDDCEQWQELSDFLGHTPPTKK